MKFALVNGERQEPQPNLSAECPVCESLMIAKCGEDRAWHWAHRSRRNCDLWWENETQWHRDWKEQFPVDWQEIVQHDEDGERHIADVKTHDDWVIEFQHSHIKPEERRAREAFYRKLTWVVDGLRRKTDLPGFQTALNEGTQIAPNFAGWKVRSDKGALLRYWAGSCAHVFFDFGDGQTLWWLSPNASGTWAYVVRISRAEFIGTHRRTETQGAQDFDSFGRGLTGLVSDYESYRRAQSLKGTQPFQKRIRRRQNRL